MSYALARRQVRPHSVHGLGCGCAMPMAGLGALTIPDYTIWSASEVGTFYNTILDAVSRLEQDISANVPRTTEGNALRAEYTAFKNDFLRNWSLYHELSLPISSSGTAVSVAREAAGRYNAFERRYRTLSGRAPTTSGIAPVEAVSEPAPRVGGLPVWAWAGIGLAGLGLVGWIALSISRSASSFSRAAVGTAMLMNRRRRTRKTRR